MIAIDHEIDFPRGGTTTADRSSQKKSKLSSKVKSGRSENQLFGVDKKQTTKKRKPVAVETPSKKRKLDGKGTVWKKPITQNLLTDGVMGLGVVVEIYAHYVLLETAYSCRVKLPATQVSKKFTELLKSEEVSLESMFVVGQMVPFRVIERSSLITEKKYRSNGKKYTSENLPVVTCDPTRLNAHITPQTLMPGLVLHAVVVSQEEKGVVMDIGMQSMQAFLPTEKQQRPVQVGQPVIVRVDSLKTSRVVVVNSYVERDNLCLETCESLVLNHLMPGTIIECVPDPQPSVSAGVYVTFGNGLRGFVAKNHLPPRLRSDITKVGKTLRCVVMFCQQNTPLLVLSAHPDIVAISKPEKRASFLGYSIGDRLKCQVIDVVPSKFLVCFSLPTSDDGKVPLIAAISYKQYLKKLEKFETFYSIGSEHKCRIMSLRYADRCIVVSDRKDVFNQKFVSYSDAVLGEVVNAKVTDVHPRGVQVTVNEMIKGFIPLDHVADKKIALEKDFTVGTNVECRVLLVNEKKKQIWLTARPSLVKFKGVLITSYSPNYDGIVTVGTVAKILETGGAVVQFFGAVRGLLPATETRKIADEIRQGMVLNVRVISINASEEKMVLSLADESLCAPKHIINPKSVNLDTNGKLVFTGVVDDVCENESIGGRKSEKILLHLECDSSVKGFLIPIHFSDFLDSPLESMRKSFLKGYKLSPITPLGSVGGINRFTSKRFICTWLECFEKDIPKCLDDLRPRQLVCGVISQRDPDDCLYVEIAGGSGLLGKVAFEDVDGEKDGACSLQVGQTVVGSIRSVHAEKKTFRISLKLAHCVPREHLPSKVSSPAATMALQLVRSCVEEVLEFTRFSKVKLPIHGTAVISTVSQIVDDELFVLFSGKLAGRIRKGNYSDGVKVGDKIKCLVVDYVFPSNNAELVMVGMADGDPAVDKRSKKKSQMEEGTGNANRVVLTKRDYIVVLDSEKIRLIFIPSRFHPNQVVEIKNLRVSLGDEVDLGDTIPITDGIHIGLLKGDVDLINKLMLPTEHLPRTFPDKKTAKLRSNELRVSKASKAKLGLRTRTVKNLSTYTGVVVGPWICEDRRDRGKLAAKIKLPGGTIGRLHVSELPSRLLIENTFPLERFLKKYGRKSVNVKIIKFISIKKKDMKIRVAELTMNENKIAETRKKATAVALQTKFKPGEILRCFISPDQDLTKKMIRVEVNPLWSGQIAIEASSEDLKIEAPDHNGEVFEDLPKPGEMRLAEVLSARKLKKSQGRGILSLAFDMQASVMRFEVGQRLTGRVIRVNIHPISVLFQLPNGQQATLCATAIANNYEKVAQHITHFKRNGIFHLYALRQDQNPQRNYVCAEGRYESYLKQKEANEYSESRRLFVDRGEVTVGLTCDGFLAKHTSEAVLVEIGPGIIGRLRKSHHPEVTSIALNSILSVRVRRIDGKGRISLSLVKIVAQVSRSKDRKRKIDDEQCGVVKKEKKEKSPTEDIERVVLSDPGFDWSNTGFLPEDLAAVGKIGDELVNESFSAQPSNSSESDAPKKTEVKEGRVKDEKPMSKEELEMEKERLMVNREIKLSGDLVPETQEDFSRLLRKDPNSAEIWIRYISFFLEKNDLSMARATAERALTVINYREETEIFNIWTAYLNMEVMYGDENSTKEIFQRSCGNADALKMHIQMAAIFSEAGKVNEADEVYEAMLKKFRANSDDVWTLYGEHLMKTDRADKARDLMKRALTSVPKQRHVPIISRFAQMEFRNGDIERGRTLFESLVSAYPRKTDLWLVYADLSLKHSGMEMTRQILERACSLRLSMHKLRPIFRKWMEAEERFGDDKSRLLLREKAEKFLERNLDEHEDVGE